MSERPLWMRWAWAWLLTPLPLTVMELALIPELAATALKPAQRHLVLPALAFGNLLPYAAVAVAAFAAAHYGYEKLERRTRRPRLWFALGLGTLATPYAYWLSDFTFSGPTQIGLWYRPILIAVGAFAVVLAVGGVIGLSVWRHQRRVVGVALASVALGLAIACLVTSSAILPNEYEPLHAALMFFALLLAAFAAVQIASLLPSDRRRWPAAVVLGILVAGSVASGVVLALRHNYAWVVWGGTPGSRYLTWRWDLFEVRPAAAGRMLIDRPPPDWASDPRVLAERIARRKALAPHIVVFSIDNVQPDHVGAYGYRRRPTTPNIDRIAKSGVIFRRAYSFCPQTRVFMSSMLFGRKTPEFLEHRPPPEYKKTALTTQLKERGYQTLIKGVFELTAYREFNPNDYNIDTWLVRETTEQIRQVGTLPVISYDERFRHIERHLKRAGAAKQPVFIWTHWLQPHWHKRSFVPSPGFPFGDTLIDKYDSAIAGSDALLGRLQGLMAKYLKDGRPTVWVVQSDHGAGLGASRKERGKTLHERYVHVPLIISGPGIAPGTVDTPIDSAVDSAATLLDLVGLPVPDTYEGTSLLPLFLDPAVQRKLDERVIVMRSGHWRGAVYGKFKYMDYRGAVSMFDVLADPMEKNNLANERGDLLQTLRPAVRKHVRRISESYARR